MKSWAPWFEKRVKDKRRPEWENYFRSQQAQNVHASGLQPMPYDPRRNSTALLFNPSLLR